jgi:RHS repeat-associated protein
MYEHYPNDISPADIVANYKYDIYGRRLQKNVNGTIINFSWEDDNLALELDENLQPLRRYVYGVGKDDVEGYVELSEVTGGMFNQYKQGWYSYIKDQVGTIFKVYSDYTQQMVDIRTYDVFGNMVKQTGSSTGNLGFHSKYYDQESGLYYFYYRYYTPIIGRFINEDQIGLPNGLNLFTFTNNNPINFTDPFGLLITDPSFPTMPGAWPDDEEFMQTFKDIMIYSFTGILNSLKVLFGFEKNCEFEKCLKDCLEEMQKRYKTVITAVLITRYYTRGGKMYPPRLKTVLKIFIFARLAYRIGIEIGCRAQCAGKHN